MGSWTVRAEVAGDGHIQYFEHLTTEECAELVNELISDGIWENIHELLQIRGNKAGADCVSQRG